MHSFRCNLLSEIIHLHGIHNFLSLYLAYTKNAGFSLRLNMIKKISISIISVFVLTNLIWAQQFVPCATDELYTEQTQQNPELKIAEQKANEYVRSQLNSFTKKGNGIIYIPVVFHIIHDDSLQNISQAQIMNQLRILNQDYRKLAGTPGFSTEAVASDVQVEFRLAQYDPNGNKSDGIIRIRNAATNNANDATVKPLSYWDSNKYLNIWVVKTINLSNTPLTGTVLGYAQFPWTRNSKPTTDGIVLRADQVGVVGIGQGSQGGRTLTHEVGHWLGLYHTFQDGCAGGTTNNCASQGDQVCDTPPVAEANYGCKAATANSCSNDVPDLPDQIKNYMDYSDGTCMNLFTVGQKSRIYAMLASFRNTIYGNNINNVAYAGINSADGTYLPLTNASIKAPYAMYFEGNSFTTDGWKINNFNNPNNGWQQNNAISFSGTSCMYMRNFNNDRVLFNGRDGFQSPEIELRTTGSPFLEFRYAYAQRSTASIDSLLVFISNDFGMTETRIFAQRGTSLATVANTTATEFIPLLLTDFRKVSINLSLYQQYNHARFRFEFVNRRGNNIFIDNFTITNGATGIGEQAKKELSFEVYPNPMEDQSTITFNLKHTSPVTITLKDMMGKTIYVMQELSLQAGQQSILIPKKNLSSGLYLIDFKSNETQFSHKLLVN
jgi:hypothetical protein